MVQAVTTLTHFSLDQIRRARVGPLQLDTVRPLTWTDPSLAATLARRLIEELA
jgi:hypothetical protein